FLSDIAGDLSSLNFFELWGAWDTAASYGYPSDTIRIETISRLVRPFGFLILSLASIGIGWLLRPESGVPSVFGILFIPAFPFAAYFTVLIYEYLHRVIIGSTLIAWGFIPALIIFLAIEFILIVISIFSITGQSLQNSEPS
ncbi:MAG: hypothetical protein HN368_22145, partial [Spirochaetales bacterium]|nr:hypothetical protein [Spirochaetales bacterium]